MPCNQNCNQGRECTCQPDRSIDRATVVVVTLLLIFIFFLGFVTYQILHGNTGSPCAVEVQFKDSKATYIGHSV